MRRGRRRQPSPQPKDSEKRFVDAPYLLGREVPNENTESPAVHRAALLDQHSGPLSLDLSLRAKGRSSCAPRRRRDDHHRAGKELGRLDHNAVAIAVLLVPDPLRKSKPIDVTPQHEALP